MFEVIVLAKIREKDGTWHRYPIYAGPQEGALDAIMRYEDRHLKLKRGLENGEFSEGWAETWYIPKDSEDWQPSSLLRLFVFPR